MDRTVPTLALILLLVAAMALPGLSAMPPQPGASGLTEGCRHCHVNATSSGEAGSSITIVGVPERYEPGREYLLTIELERGAGPRPSYAILHAFQLGVTGGTLEVSGVDMVTIDDREVGSRGASNATSWTATWTAPEEGDVHLYAAGVIGDGDGTEEGDVRVEAQEVSYGPLDVPHDDPPGPLEGRVEYLVLAALLVTLLAVLLIFTHQRPPPREMD